VESAVLLADIGNYALIAAFAFAIASILASLTGARLKDTRLLAIGERSVYAVFLLVTIAIGTLWSLLLNDQFAIRYIYGHSSEALPLAYKIGSLWSGQEGSLLLWTFVLAGCSAVAVFTQRHRHNRLLPYAIPVMMVTALFFLFLNNFRTNPFEQWTGITAAGGEVAFTPEDGRGLNPLLQHWAMVIHPPILYIGYIGFVIPFAFCVAALITRQLGSAWVVTVRRWTLTSWIFLATGILLGGKWAYMELGWGGYWAWDPVENASLIPWLTGTAFLHSVIVQEKRGMLKVWNVTLICLTYLLSIVGTFLTRSGVVSSVHSFAQSNVGDAFGLYLVLATVGCAVLILMRLPDLRSEGRIDSFVSREAGFLFNNLLFLVLALAVLFGTVFPIFSELITGRVVNVNQPFFNFIAIPIGLLILWLTGIGPLLAYRKTSSQSLRKNFTMPTIAGILAGPLFFALARWAMGDNPGMWALLSVMLCVFVIATIVQEFHAGAITRMRQHKELYLQAVLNLTRRNNRRYGGYIVHLGIVLIFIGITGQAFTREVRGVVGQGESFQVGPYSMTMSGFRSHDDDLYEGTTIDLVVAKNDRALYRLSPEKRFYKASEQPASEVAIARQLNHDIYVVFAGVNESGDKAVIQAYINPLVAWVWIGGAVMIIGTLIGMLPGLKTRRTEVAS
jgi:cytochrome c-type biogenesis protein CcmF